MSKIAVFFDAENISSTKVPEIIAYLSTKGDILFQRAYADWSIPATKSWQNQISKTPITAYQQFHHDQEQAVDKAVMMDAIELAIKHEELDYFAVIASDNGYYSLALRLRELGKRVIGIGDKNKCSPIWINSCNEFTYFQDLEEIDDDILLESEKTKDAGIFEGFAVEKFVEKAFDSTPFYKGTNTKLLSQLWESILRQKPDFNTKSYGYKSAREFIISFKNLFKVSDDGKDQRTLFVEKVENQNSKRKTGTVKRRIKRYRIIEADDKSGDYFFHITDVNSQFKDEKFDKGTKVDFLIEREPDSSANDQKLQNGRAIDVCIIK